MTRIITDIDDTVLDFAEGFSAWVKERGITTVAESLTAAGSITGFIGCSRPMVDAILYDYAHDGEAFGQLPALPYASHVLIQLAGRRRFRFTAISSCVTSHEITRMRRANLERELHVRFDAVHCIGLGESKADLLASYEPAIWVEDNLEHARAGAKLGHQTFLLDRPYNQGVAPGVTRVADWFEIGCHLGVFNVAPLAA